MRIGQRAGRHADGDADAAFVELHQGGLLHRHGHGLGHLLRDLHAVAGGAGFGRHGPILLLHVEGHGHVPASFGRRVGLDADALWWQNLGADLRGEGRVHGLGSGVSQGEHGAVAVALAHQRWHARDDLQILRGRDAGTAGAKQASVAALHRISDDDDSEGRERVVQGHFDQRFALGVEHHARVPQQQGVEQFAGGELAAPTAWWRGLLAEVPLANDLHLRRGGVHAIASVAHHGAQQVPAVIGAKFQQGFVHGGQGHFGARGHGLAIGQADLHAHLAGGTDGVAGLVRLHRHFQLVRSRAHFDLGNAVLESRLGQVDHGRRRLVVAPIVVEGLPPLSGRAPAPGEEAVPGHVVHTATHGQH